MAKSVKAKSIEKESLKKKNELINALFVGERVIAENSDLSRELYDKSRFGYPLSDGKFQLSLVEAFYLLTRGRLVIKDYHNKVLDEKLFIRRAKKYDPKFWVRYSVFSDLRNRGYIVKTALKFGADFRVYPRGVKPGEDHAKWIVYPVHESEVLTWYEFAAKNRVAHSTRKKLLIGIVDEEGDVTYYEIKWLKP